MEEIIKKADVLIEALPYIRRFNRKVFVIKFGGSALDYPEIRKGVLEDVAFMHFVGIRPVLVHGGGPAITKRMKEKGVKVEFVEGKRLTDTRTMEVVDEVLGEINEMIVKELQANGVKARGLHGKRDKIVHGKAAKAGGGEVGEVDSINAPLVEMLFSSHTVPVVSPVGVGEGGKLYNVNADEVASHLAAALPAEKLVLLTDVRGIMTNREDEQSVLSTLTEAQAETLIENKVISEGMIPKVRAGLYAIGRGVAKTHIIDGTLPHSLLLEIFTDQGIGTEIVKT